MDIFCEKGCCKLKILPKNKIKKQREHYPFEKRKAGVFICSGEKVLLVQSYNNFWGIPKGQVEQYDDNIRVCAERELLEETGLSFTLKDNNLWKILLDYCYIYKIFIENTDDVNLENLQNLDSTGIGWIKVDCAFDFNITFLTRKILMENSWENRVKTEP